jgi:uncharacterized membrane protein YjgN (DUF898 family)
MSAQGESAFQFDGRWREYLPIALTNLLLTIVTLGIYRFWATTRSRHYLWSRTRFIDEHFEWTGTGGELFKGFLLALALFSVPFLIIQFGVQALAMRGYGSAAGTISTAAGLGILFITGLARFRALRYRLSRTYWHGIRGGSDDNGVGYGFMWAFKTAISYVTIWLLVPWAMVTLWNERWEVMSFGSTPFRSEARVGPVFKRFLLFYLAPILVLIAIVVAFLSFGPTIATLGRTRVSPESMPMVALGILAVVVIAYTVLGLIALVYYAVFMREVIGHLSLGDIHFHFTGRTMDFLKLFIGDVLLVVATLGIGLSFISYRHWRFYVTHLEATGDISLSALGQSTTRMPKQGEGLLDALDIGAF